MEWTEASLTFRPRLILHWFVFLPASAGWEVRAPLRGRSLVPRAHGLKAGGLSFAFLRRPCRTDDHLNSQRRNAPAACASGGVPPRRSPPGSFRCLPAAGRTITNTQCPGYRTAEPSDRPPWASRYERPAASPFASRDGLPRMVPVGPGWPRPAASGGVNGASVFPIAPRRSPHGSDRSTPSRAAPPSRLPAAPIEAFPLDRAL